MKLQQNTSVCNKQNRATLPYRYSSINVSGYRWHPDLLLLIQQKLCIVQYWYGSLSQKKKHTQKERQDYHLPTIIRSTGFTLAAWTLTRTSWGRHITGIKTDRDNVRSEILPYLCSCQADIVDNSMLGCEDVDNRRKIKNDVFFRQQNAAKHCVYILICDIIKSSVHHQTQFRAFTVTTENKKCQKNSVAADLFIARDIIAHGVWKLDIADITTSIILLWRGTYLSETIRPISNTNDRNWQP